MIKLETHCHSRDGSPCADARDDVFVEDYVKAGYGAIVLTNHVSSVCYDYVGGETHAQKIRNFHAIYERVRELFAPSGIKVFCGAEIRVLPEGKSVYGEEFTVYGITEKIMRDNKPLFTFTQEELFRLAEKHGLFMYQTHPFRERVYVGNPEFLHGVEVFNGHFHHSNYNAVAENFCKEHGLIGLSGTDYHHDRQPVCAGIYIPESINTCEQLTEFLFKNKFQTIKDELLYESSLREYRERK